MIRSAGEFSSMASTFATSRSRELRALIGYVQQDIFLFAGDVLTNIRLSNPISEEDVADRRRRASGADRVIRRLPHGYAQVLGERGASISVGERQLLSFARAIAADPALLVLDEATSAVDSEIEAEIQARAGGADAGPNDDRGRASIEYNRRCRRDSRAAPRSGARARNAPRSCSRSAGYTSVSTDCRRARCTMRCRRAHDACQP